MSAARPVLPGRYHLLTRRCSERRYFLRPGKKTNQAVLYCLFEAAIRFDMDVIAFVAMSNHLHVVIYDRNGNYPEFIEHLHKMLAKVMNCRWGRWEAMWASEQTSVVRLVELADVFAKIIYTLCNPVAAHLVDRVAMWPGASSWRANLTGAPIVVDRPRWFFAKEGRMPKRVEYRLRRPAGFEHLSQEAWARMLKEAVEAEERRAAEDREHNRTRIVGRRQVLRQSPFSSPTSHEPRRNIRPRIAARNKWRRIEALTRNAAWLTAYRVALRAYRVGDALAMFPAGTYQLRIGRHVRCHPFPGS